MNVERRAVEFRQTDAGTLEGTVITYGAPSDIAGLFTERFQPGSISYDRPIVNFQHDRAQPLAREGRGLILTNTATEMRAVVTLPDTTLGRDVRQLIDGEVLRGFSIEMQVLRDEFVGTARTIFEARMTGLGLVDDPAHDGSVIDEVRARIEAAINRADSARLRYWL